ncbi:MAG: type II toxin-antitoxin system HipA family toxin [Deltaproteobacteria bacterium]|nr:type II toxin-antitoxin system HipA family toxin [Deltaproteobacteria bacterium]MBT4638225.1 type II toxin-antitoxin system HipA family toxin [Deltaproteobacteria bacterium]
MVDKVETAIVKLWGDVVGAVSWLNEPAYGVFEFDPTFLKKGLDISPIHMGLAAAGSGDGIFFFPGLNRDTFYGLPGLLADSLPDRFGNMIINAWLARKGRDIGSFSPIERLCYVGSRAIGALEFRPLIDRKLDRSVAVEIAELVGLVQQITSRRSNLAVNVSDNEKENEAAILDILRIGTSAGGARPKAIIAMNGENHVISGQADVPQGYDYWILKFDGVDDLELGKSEGYGRIEYAYYLMAVEAGLKMTECRLLEENQRAHFMTKRFDRQNGRKIHIQSLCGLAHYDFNMAGATSYEQAFAIMRKLHLSKADAVQQYRRMVFNVMARNQDDHTKNMAFLMDREGHWKLSPAFDVMYSHNPAGKWTNQHQMTLNGKRDNFTLQDIIAVGESISIPKPQTVIREVRDSVERWPEFAQKAGVSKQRTHEIRKYHRLTL